MRVLINFLTFFRILSAILIFVLIYGDSDYTLVLLIFFLASVSDFFDGYLARKYNLTSVIGEIIDPIADKILITFVLIAISMQLSSFYVAFLSCIIISREIWVAALRDYNARVNMSESTKVTFIAKTKTSFQMLAITFYLLSFISSFTILFIISDILLLLAMIITVYTGYDYTKKTFKF